ncbi:alpha/beta hydrolase fold domain-containing protein [Pseudolysinimonas sp.]|uniref:alpha/beta hydrolase fold domain-containing protein n=1 Tax=Pseudolysinimonas sp. TaxID=2680009 RepID=UPI00286A2D32|nr:alpha/beta hydrolase fold domain-containing protein [Pseudolysinimonas sp.]
MSILSRPKVASTVAKAMQGLTGAILERALKPHERFPEHPGRTEKLTVPTSVAPAELTIYRPESGEPLPAVHVNFHGGGYVLRGAVLDDPLCRTIVALAGVVVINVDYVVAPQHRFPALPQQAYDVVAWVAANGAEHGWDASRLTIGGQSAGGALAAAAARLALENGTPAITLQVLHYPPLDLSVPASTKSSTIAKPALKPWMGEVFDTAYVPNPADRADRLVSPAGSADTADLTGIAPAVVLTAGQDILLAEGKRYAERLRKAGALVEYVELEGVDHGYDTRDLERAREVYAQIAGFIKAAVKSPRTKA